MNNETTTEVAAPPAQPKPYSEDEPPPEADEQLQFKWRGNPELTFSDWTIEIVTKKELIDDSGNEEDNSKDTCPDDPGVEVVETYHVHKKEWVL